LKDQLPAHFLDNAVQGVQRIAEVIEDAHEEHVIEFAGNDVGLIDRHLEKLDVQLQRGGGKAGLAQVAVVEIDSDHTGGVALFHLDGIKTGVTSQVEHRRAGKILGQGGAQVLPLYVGIIAQEMLWRRPHAAQVDVVEPVAELGDLLLQLLGGK
jgi:hypothetical protein